MEKAWEKAVEAARGEQDPSETVSLTLDGALKCAQCRLPPPALFEQFSRLQHLSIANAGLTSLEGFPCLPQLKRLVLSDNRISGGLEYLVQAGLKSLQDLDLSNNRVQVFEDLVPLSQLNLLSLDLYECPVTRLPGYRARVFGIVKSLQYLDKTDVDGKERFESDDEGEEVDSEDEEDVDDFNGEDKSNGFRSVNPAGDQDEEDFDEEDEEDELDVDEEDEYQDGVTINGHGAAGGHMAASASAGPGNSSDDDEVEDEDDCDNAEVQDVEEEDEEDSDEVAEADDDDAGVAEDDEDDDGTEQASGAPGELDIQEDVDNVEDEDGELGDEEDDDEGVENDGEDDGEEEEEDYGTEYLVQPIGKPEDDEGGSDFEPVDDGGEDEDIDEDEDDDHYVVGNQKRSRDEVDNDSEDEERNPKRR
eukprot:Gb_34082 [translate_table: standard]